ncbi:MAG: undecaprenyldiphospho-muramoylpentapeptide beta-N-acetylglucosaminyltransferase, partial [Parasporobacterium sp.]|nr:undecaprenyldiphospho-muramoylpentapeptide beta-N-acetylglucosaminyltransferase [Parasporobacterium sp.]
RRYLSVQNLKDPVHILKGLHEAKAYMKEHRPDVVFSKGGFVAVPVVMAAHHYHIPVVIHESDLSPGLANKLCIPYADKICYSFPETAKYLTHGEPVHTGLPVRGELLSGSKEAALKFCGFDGTKPVLTVIGGSLGAQHINEVVEEDLSELLKTFDIAHICGKGKTNPALNGTEGYIEFEYVDKELKDIFAASDVFISRAGANVIYELAALNKPALLIPLGSKASRGDQILNAESFRKRGFCDVLMEDDLTAGSLTEKITALYNEREKYAAAMEAADMDDAARAVAEVIASVVK